MIRPRTLALACALSIGLSVFSTFSPALAATVFDPGTRWYTIETPHFRINYPQGQAETGQKAANYAEEAYSKHMTVFKKAPDKTEITLVDNSDEVNGFALPVPNAAIYVYLNTPGESELWGKYDSFLRTVITHELAHVLHYEANGGIVDLGNKIFGRAFYPNLYFNPMFMLEGLAVVYEGKHSPLGRLDESYFDAVLRTSILEKKGLAIDQVGGYQLTQWPGGMGTYIYGSALSRYLIETYGPDTLIKIAETLGTEPFGVNWSIWRVTGKSAYQVWDDMILSLETRYARQLKEIQAKHPLTASTSITESGRYHRFPAWLPDGRLLYNEADGRKSARVVAFTEQKKERLFNKPALEPNALSADGRYLYHAREVEIDHYTTGSDLFRYDLQLKKNRQLTEGKHLQSPALSPDGKRLLAVHSHKGVNNLVLLDPEGKELKQLTKEPDFTQISSPKWSPDGRRAVVSAWKDGSRDLFLIDPEKGEMKPLWRDKALDLNPVYSPDGQNILFASDRTGIFNLYAYRLQDGKQFQITNVVGGAVEPAVSPDHKKLAFTGLSSQGFDTHLMAYDPTAWWEDTATMPSLARIPAPKAAAPAGIHYPEKSYDPLPSLMPKTWSPFLWDDDGGTVLGVTTFGQDVLFQHNFSLLAGYGLYSHRPLYYLSYTNDQLAPSLRLGLSDSPIGWGLPLTNGTTLPWWQRQRTASVGFNWPGIPGLAMGTNWITGESYSAGFNWSQVDDLTHAFPRPNPALPDIGRTNSLYAMYQKADNYTYAYSVAPEGGSLSTLGLESSRPAWGSQFSYERLWLDYRRYHPAPWENHSFAWRFAGGANWGKTGGQYYLGGYDSASITTLMDLRFGVSSYTQQTVPLRGYGYMKGDRLLALSGEYRFPLWETQRGVGTLPFFFDRLAGACFYDIGQIWGGQNFGPKHGLGAEARLVSHIFQVPTELRFGAAQGLSPMGQTQLYFQLGSAF